MRPDARSILQRPEIQAHLGDPAVRALRRAWNRRAERPDATKSDRARPLIADSRTTDPVKRTIANIANELDVHPSLVHTLEEKMYEEIIDCVNNNQ